MHSRFFILLLAGGLGLTLLPRATGLAQKRGRGSVKPAPAANATKGPKRGRGVNQPVEAIISATIIKEVRPNEGALVLVAAPDAQVTLTRAGRSRSYKITQAGTITLTPLLPGAYKLQLTHPDYEPLATTINIVRGKPTTVTPALRAKFGAALIGGLPAGVSVWLDGRRVENATLDEQGRLSLPRLPVGAHRLRCGKDGHDDWETRLEIKPGEPLLLTARMPLATITLTLKTVAGARVSLDAEEKGLAQSDGLLVVRGLAPGDYRLSVLLDGYEPLERPLSLRLSNRARFETVELIPIAASSEATDTFTQGLAKWSPAPPTWQVAQGVLQISGPALALFKDVTETRAANVYYDFNWTFDVGLSNSKGAAWVIRAKDRQNYYLFELTTARAEQPARFFNFYVCRDGKLTLKDRREVVENLERPGDSFHLTVRARGSEFHHTISSANSPQRGEQPLGTFTDNSFAYGGLGFQAINGIEMKVFSFIVIPEKRAGQNTR
jgi:hypothetical protein